MALDPAKLELRRVKAGDADRLAAFYNSRSQQSVRHFKPLGEQAALQKFVELIAANSDDAAAQLDVVAVHDADIVGWAFAWKILTDQPKFGIVVGDQFQGQRIGDRLMAAVISAVSGLGLKQLFLTVVTDNARAIRLYQKFGFQQSRKFVSREDRQAYYEMVWRSKILESRA